MYSYQTSAIRATFSRTLHPTTETDTEYMSRVMRKPTFCICEKTKTHISFAVTAKLISAFVFAKQIVQSLNFLDTKFQASSYLLWLYSLVCVRPGRKPRRPVFSQRGSNGKMKSGESRYQLTQQQQTHYAKMPM